MSMLYFTFFGLITANASSSPNIGTVHQGCEGEGVFDCGNGVCLDDSLLCNGVPECHSATDESIQICGCLPNEFRCLNSCIDLLKRCDTMSDCQNGEDEIDCKTFQCPVTHFKCKNYFCIPLDLVCNFVDNCGDNSDELKCLHRDCWNQEFKCQNGECIRPGFLCDGNLDCKDNSDESNCTSDDFVTCGDGSRKHRYYWCDGWPDCVDNHADELNCGECKGEDDLLCSNGRCIKKVNVCDSVCDCLPVGNSDICEDEVNCQHFYTNYTGVAVCKVGSTLSCLVPGHFGTIERCVQQKYICDGTYNLHTGGEILSDEFGCDHSDSEGGNFFQCKDSRWLPMGVICDYRYDCLHGDDEENCPEDAPCEEVEFQCGSGQCINMYKRCDLSIDCWDKSDETNCVDYNCPLNMIKCNISGHCLFPEQWCDFFDDCYDKSDEANCLIRECTEGEFRCDNGQCIDMKHRCLNLGFMAKACVDKSHLKNCEDWVCRNNQFKCRKGPCLESSLICNGKIDCLDTWEDEESCTFVCSSMAKECECKDVHINCTGRGIHLLPEDTEREITWYHFGSNYLGPNFQWGNVSFHHFEHSLYLDLSNNSIEVISPLLFAPMWRLTVLNLQNNLIEELFNSSFYGLSNVIGLHLQKNRIHTIHPMAFYGLSSLPTLDLRGQRLVTIKSGAFVGLRNLVRLDISINEIQYLEDGTLRGLPRLLYLDISHNQIKAISPSVFRTVSLHTLLTDEFRFCCLARHVVLCYPPPDEFSSCEDLMSNIVLRVCVWALALVAISGNVLVIFWRAKFKYCNKVHSFLITNLALGDLLMGTYLLLIAVVDWHYRGVYFIHDSTWRSSQLCSLAGFISTFSSELSVFTLTVITVDRFHVIINPFRVRKLKMAQTRQLMAFVWITAASLSAIPLLNYNYFRNFYGRSGVCLALHITPDKPSGWEYSVFVFLFLNLMSFTVIAVGYLWMFLVARMTHHAVVSKVSKSSDSIMAWRMTLLVATDAACWVPIIFLGILSLAGFTVPPQVFAWVAVFVLPLNAALNPVLYTLSTAPFLAPARSGLSSLRRSCHMSLNSAPRDTPHHNHHQQINAITSLTESPSLPLQLPDKHYNILMADINSRKNYLPYSTVDQSIVTHPLD